MVLGGSLGLYVFRVQINCFFQIFQSLCLVPFISVVGGNTVVGPGVMGILIQHLLEEADGFIVVFPQFLGHGHIEISLYVVRVDGEGFLDGPNAFFR